MPKSVKGGHFGLFETPVCCKIPKKWSEPFRDKKSRKVAQCRKKFKGGPIALSAIFCSDWSRKSKRTSKTSRKRHESAPRSRLKNSKRTSKCPVFFYSTRKTQKMDRIGGRSLEIFHPFCRKSLKNEEVTLWRIFLKKPQCQKQWKGNPFVSSSFVWYAKKNSYSSVPWAKRYNLAP